MNEEHSTLFTMEPLVCGHCAARAIRSCAAHPYLLTVYYVRSTNFAFNTYTRVKYGFSKIAVNMCLCARSAQIIFLKMCLTYFPDGHLNCHLIEFVFRLGHFIFANFVQPRR